MRIVSCDIETTGLSEDTCDILEFGAVLDDLRSHEPIECLPVFHCYFVLPIYRGEPFALSMHPTIFKRIAAREGKYNYISAGKLGYSFKMFLNEHGYKIEQDRVTINVAGKNFGIFDYHFLRDHTDLEKHVKIRHKIDRKSVV